MEELMEERMQILNLLEQGKVNVDEAVKLIEALGGNCCEPKDEECCEAEEGEKIEENR
jgi:hypothetical protein